MQLKHSRSFHKLRCRKSHQLEVVGGKEKKKRKNWRKTREVRVKAVTRSPLQSTALEGLRQQKYLKSTLKDIYKENYDIFGEINSISPEWNKLYGILNIGACAARVFLRFS
jgi:hypothetical protein